MLGDIAASGLGALGLSWQSAPALTEVEEVVLEWLRELTGLPPEWRGVIQDTASTACLVALLAARERVTDYSEARGGLQAEPAPLVVYTTEQAHSSVAKAALLAGFGRDNLRLVDTDPHTYAMRPDALAAAIEADLARGSRPAAVVATVGTTGTTAVDPVAGIAAVTGAHQVWLHVDAAMAGSALLLPEMRWLIAGIEGADSLSWNPHKWLGTILDCSVLYVKDPEHLIRVMSTNPSYLRSAVDGEVTQYRDWGIPLGRRFRALKLWFHLRLDGTEAIRAAAAARPGQRPLVGRSGRSRPGWRILAPVALQTVVLRHEPDGLVVGDRYGHRRRCAEPPHAGLGGRGERHRPGLHHTVRPGWRVGRADLGRRPADHPRGRRCRLGTRPRARRGTIRASIVRTRIHSSAPSSSPVRSKRTD